MSKLSALLCLSLWILTGCAQIFDNNLYSSVDKPNLSSMNLSSMSLTDLRNYMHDQSFLTALRSDNASLTTIQTNLSQQLALATVNADKVKILQTYVLITGLGSPAYSVAGNFLNFLSSNISGLNNSSSLQSTLIKIFPSGMGTSDQLSAVTQLINIGIALQLAKSSSSTSSDFFAGLSGQDCGSIAQIGAMGSLFYVMYLNSNKTSASLAALDIVNFLADSTQFTQFSLDGLLPFSTASYNLGMGLTQDFSDANKGINNQTVTDPKLSYLNYLSSYLGH